MTGLMRGQDGDQGRDERNRERGNRGEDWEWELEMRKGECEKKRGM